MTKTITKIPLATEDVIVPAPKPTTDDIADLKATAKEPMDTDALGDPTPPRRIKNVTPKPKRVTKITRKPSTTKKTAAKSKAVKPTVARVSAKTFLAELTRLGLTKSDAARALSLSPSSISEFSGSGRKRLMAEDRWPSAKKSLAAYAAKRKAEAKAKTA